MKNKQTAVQWLEDNLNFEPYDEEEFISNNKIWEQAKQMEKEQMIKFAMHLHDVDISKTGTDILMEEAEQYYNETYDVKDN
jgi:hypothetical protein